MAHCLIRNRKCRRYCLKDYTDTLGRMVSTETKTLIGNVGEYIEQKCYAEVTDKENGPDCVE